MTASINASTSAGVVVTSDTSGSLALQTANTTAMTINSSQQVGIGNSSPSYVLDLSGSASPICNINSTNTNGCGMKLGNSGTTFGYIGSAKWVLSGNLADLCLDATGSNNLIFATNDTERARIDSSSNLLVGGTSQSGTANRVAVFSANKFGLSVIDTTAQATGVGGALNLGGNYRSAGDAQAFARVSAVKQNSTDGDYGYGMAFSVTPNGGTFTEAGRFDSSGNLLVGTTSFAPTSNQGISLQPPQNGGYGITVTSSVSTVSSGGLQMYSTGAGAYRFYVDFSGTIHATNTSITAISDQSLKTNIKPLETGLTQILALQPRRFDWTEESKNEAKNVAGFIAQEVEQVLPDLVAPFRYNDTETKLGLKMGDMIPTMVKAIQELNTLVTTQAQTITSMQSTITALQTKVGA